MLVLAIIMIIVCYQFLSKKLGVDTVVFGYMETVFAVVMLIGGPLFGRFGDLFGARAALLVAMASSFLTYAILSQASSIAWLFLSRVMAFMMHAMHGMVRYSLIMSLLTLYTCRCSDGHD